VNVIVIRCVAFRDVPLPLLFGTAEIDKDLEFEGMREKENQGTFLVRGSNNLLGRIHYSSDALMMFNLCKST